MKWYEEYLEICNLRGDQSSSKEFKQKKKRTSAQYKELSSINEQIVLKNLVLIYDK